MSNNDTELYPLKFRPHYHRKIWGGEKIFNYKGEKATYSDVGEAWEISPMLGSESVVAEGSLEGQTLVQLTQRYKGQLLGQQVAERYDGRFPLLIKMIDANDDLSVQVHPNDLYASQHHNGSWGKTEMWYLLECTSNATIYAGWKKETTPQQLRKLVQTGEVMNYLDTFTPAPGDVFYLPAGKVHAIGAGCLLLEIQQASDITYRMYDFNRTDSQGQKRQLNIDASVAVVNYEVNKEGIVSYDKSAKNCPVLLVESPYFRTSRLALTKDYQLHLSERDSFTVLFIEQGTVELQSPAGNVVARKGETLLLPASITECHIELKTPTATLIECFVPKE